MAAAAIRVEVRIENVYEEAGTLITHETATIPPPPAEAADRDDWAYDHLFPLTGTGRPNGDAAYFVTITASDDPELVGAVFEFGL